MAEHSIQRSTSQPSMPVVTPRNSRSSISNSFQTSQTSLGPQSRRASESSGQTSPASTTLTLTLPQTPVSSIPSFRSIRNLLPFGPAKTSTSPAPNSTHIPKPSFVNFGSLRRITNDRKNSATYSRLDEPDQPPVIAIARASETFEEEMMALKRSRDLTRSGSDATASSRTSEERYVLPALSPGPPLGADLSTIIEADNSGISKHIPFLDDTTHLDADGGSLPSPFNPDQNERSRQPSPDSREASFYDLSTSKLTAEVLDALKVEDSTTAIEWLKGVNGVVVEEADEHMLHRVQASTPRAEDDEAAFDFGALDPDLAELLSPNRINGKSTGPKPVPSRLPSRVHSRNSSHPVSVPSLVPLKLETVAPRTGTIIPPTSPSRAMAQSSPTRRTASLSRASRAQAAASSLPRLMRSVSTVPPSTIPPSEGSSTPTSLRGVTKKRHQPSSPLSSQAHSSQAPSPVSSRGSSELPSRRPSGPRLTTPMRHVSSYAPGNTRLADAPIIHPPSAREKASAGSQMSPRSTSDPMRQPSTRPSLELSGTLEVNKRRRAHLFYNRKRSQSVEDARVSPTSASASASASASSSRASPTRPSSSLSNRPPTMEWLGPRTVKAFAAAGLLDGDREGSSTQASGAGRYASLRASNEREDRFVPSRLAFSEAASASSWGRNGSRVVTPSEGGVTWTGSSTFSPRTTFSGSTAPTSISASSSAQLATMQLMKEKHDLETEALLSALSDSQRTTKNLREENLQLRDRIRELEYELDEMRTQMHRLKSSGSLSQSRLAPSAFPKSIFDRPIVPPSSLAPPRRPVMQRSHSHLHANDASLSSVDLAPRRSCEGSPSRDDSLMHPRRRRASTTSSVFPNLPHNMPMLMLEETMHDRDPVSTSSASPRLSTYGLPIRSSAVNISRVEHTNQSSISSGGNISPTAASFSLTEIPGSPTSLQLRPEHEMHLGDMATLSLYAMSDEEL